MISDKMKRGVVYLFGREEINTTGLAWSSFGAGGPVNISASDAKRNIPRWASAVWDMIDMLSLGALKLICLSSWVLSTYPPQTGHKYMLLKHKFESDLCVRLKDGPQLKYFEQIK